MGPQPIAPGKAFTPLIPPPSSPFSSPPFLLPLPSLLIGEPAKDPELVAKQIRIKKKILAVGKMARVFAVLREESEKINELKSAMGSSQLPAGTLSSGAEGLKRAISGFEQAKESDADNEKLPPSATEQKKMEKARKRQSLQYIMMEDKNLRKVAEKIASSES